MPANHFSEPPLYTDHHPGGGRDGFHYLHQNSQESLIDLSGEGGGSFHLREGLGGGGGLDRNANQIERTEEEKVQESSLYDYQTTGTRIHIHPDDIHIHSASTPRGGKYKQQQQHYSSSDLDDPIISLSLNASCCCSCSNCYCNTNGKHPSTKSLFPKERKKTFLGFCLLLCGFICNSFSIFLTHQKIPDRVLHPHLPDIALDNITKRKWLNDLSDVIVLICTATSAILIVSHKHRWILSRRVFLMLSLLYTMRSVTMYATVLPLANTHVYCSPKLNSTSFGATLWAGTKEVLKLMGAGGLNFMGKKTLCGDYIFSGHTIIFMMTYLLIREYTPKKFVTLHWTIWLLSWTGIIGLLISHGHYTIDVIIGYYATTRMFWIYHALANRVENKRRSHSNHLSEVWWFPIFRYFEGNVHGKLPHEYSMPRLWKKSRLGNYAYKTLHMVS